MAARVTATDIAGGKAGAGAAERSSAAASAIPPNTWLSRGNGRIGAAQLGYGGRGRLFVSGRRGSMRHQGATDRRDPGRVRRYGIALGRFSVGFDWRRFSRRRPLPRFRTRGGPQRDGSQRLFDGRHARRRNRDRRHVSRELSLNAAVASGSTPPQLRSKASHAAAPAGAAGWRRRACRACR